jgi:hypothetical protein
LATYKFCRLGFVEATDPQSSRDRFPKFPRISQLAGEHVNSAKRTQWHIPARAAMVSRDSIAKVAKRTQWRIPARASGSAFIRVHLRFPIEFASDRMPQNAPKCREKGSIWQNEPNSSEVAKPAFGFDNHPQGARRDRRE